MADDARGNVTGKDCSPTTTTAAASQCTVTSSEAQEDNEASMAPRCIAAGMASMAYFPNGRKAPPGESGRRGVVCLLTFEKPCTHPAYTARAIEGADAMVVFHAQEEGPMPDVHLLGRLRAWAAQVAAKADAPSPNHAVDGTRIAFPTLAEMTDAAALSILLGILRYVDKDPARSEAERANLLPAPLFPVPVPAETMEDVLPSTAAIGAVRQTWRVEFCPTVYVQTHGLPAVLEAAVTKRDGEAWFDAVRQHAVARALTTTQ